MAHAGTLSGIPHPRFAAFLAVALAAFAACLGFMDASRAFVIAFDAGACVFLLSVLPLWLGGEAPAMRSIAARDDGGRGLLLVVSALVLAAILAALGGTLVARSPLHLTDLALVLGTLLLAWGFVNMVYAFHYAHLYYDQTEEPPAPGKAPGRRGDRGGLVFPGTDLPVFSDFVYFSFTIGMTFQVSDVVVRSGRLRRVVTVQGVMAFIFNLGVLALVLNVLAGIF